MSTQFKKFYEFIGTPYTVTDGHTINGAEEVQVVRERHLLKQTWYIRNQPHTGTHGRRIAPHIIATHDSVTLSRSQQP